MTKRRAGSRIMITAALLCTALAHGYPEGAPWGAADPGAQEHCASCHWERTPQRHSAHITLDGLPTRVAAGGRYDLSVVIDDARMKNSGFQIIAVVEGQPAGTFFVAPGTHMETATIGTMLRSTQPQRALAKRVRWRFVWHAPTKLASSVIFFVAASAANDDGSPFGDTVHYQKFEVAAAP